ncbi:MAG: 5'/3'-nucleotidase SurE [Myxococcota bacterium]
MPLILVSNDDGIFAPGIEALVEAVAPLGDVIVAAPDTERSGSSHAITFHTHLRVGEVKPNWWKISGTPVDCAYIGLHHLCPTKPDLVVSGINAGYNLGTDVFYSGTVGAAAEARIQGVPALAASADRGVSPRVAMPAVRRIAKAMLRSGDLSLINVNVPRPPGLTDDATEAEVDAAAAAMPLEVTRLGVRKYKNAVQARKDPFGRTYYWIGGPPLETDHAPGDDTYAVTHGTVAVTPLELDITGADPAVAQRLLDA